MPLAAIDAEPVPVSVVTAREGGGHLEEVGGREEATR